MSTDQQPPRTGLTRRGVLAAGGAAILGAAGGYALGQRPDGTPTASGPTPAPTAIPSPAASVAAASDAPAILPYYGVHQSGVTTPPALFQAFIGLDLREPTRDDAVAVMRLVTDDAARLTQGEPALGDTQPELAASAGMLTVTVGLGRSLFERLGLAREIPAQLPVMPDFSTDRFERPWSETDLMLQVGADDPVTLSHTVRMLAKDVSALTRTRWTQQGFRSPTPATPGSGATRNLMGQVDGTVNPTGDDLDSTVWIADGPDWLAGGTVLVLRRIRMLMEPWDLLDRAVQETVIGRRLDTGAPIGAAHETDPVPFDAVDDLGLPVIAADAHVRVAHAPSKDAMILRRPFNYDDGTRDGGSDVGLLFAAYMRDPRTSFIPMQERIAASDAFNRWNTTVGSATYLIPAGAREGRFIAEGLLT